MIHWPSPEESPSPRKISNLREIQMTLKDLKDSTCIMTLIFQLWHLEGSYMLMWWTVNLISNQIFVIGIIISINWRNQIILILLMADGNGGHQHYMYELDYCKSTCGKCIIIASIIVIILNKISVCKWYMSYSIICEYLVLISRWKRECLVLIKILNLQARESKFVTPFLFFIKFYAMHNVLVNKEDSVVDASCKQICNAPSESLLVSFLKAYM